jgi:PBP1b-binding outer membrane lipoprotein LpoB
MHHAARIMLAGVLACAAVACDQDKPHEYGQERPPVGDIDSHGKGLQSKDLMAATDQMAMDLLALPALNQSQTKWTIVAQAMENQTVDQRQSLDIFVDRLKTQLYQQGSGRIALIENRDRFHDFQNKELEGGGSDEYGQGSGPTAAGSAGIQPQYVLYGKMQELANRGTGFYRAEFNLTDLKTREIIWTGQYEVKVRR